MAERSLQAGFWLALVFCTYMALAPNPPDAGFEVSDVVLHGLAFSTLTFTLSISHYRCRYLVPALWMLGYGVVIEVAQSQIPERSAEFKDLLVDVAGILAGMAAVRLVGPWAVSACQRLVGSRTQVR